MSPAVVNGTVSIRMYRGLLGDFFLVTHRVGPGQIFKMLIDCGVLQRIGTEKAKPSTSLGAKRVVAGVADLLKDTGGSVDLMVATHEHYDHLSGFILARKQFENFKIGKVWMAWTEDRSDSLANRYRNKKGRALAALAALADSSAFAATAEMETVNNLLQFHGDIDKLSGKASCEAVLDWVRRRAGMDNLSFLKPGDVVHWGVAGAFRAYVLGPPRDDGKLRQLNPSQGAAREVYLARSEDVDSLYGLAEIHSSHEAPLLKDMPFARPHWRSYTPRSDRRTRRLPRKLSNDPIVRIYEGNEEHNRRIDGEWLGSAENLALKIDGDVNNTSLALALELADRRVLLFPGDAQVGNWLSWGDQTYPADDRKDASRLKIEELLARTIFYKVGHHASHNATLRDRGLELMTNQELCAMIPVVEKTAREQKTERSPRGWAMPYGDLYKRLEARTTGRIVRGDGIIAEERRKFSKGSAFSLSFGGNSSDPGDPLWAELTLQL
jgi:hypothetical protein